MQLEAIGLANVDAGARDDLVAANVADRALDLDRDLEEPFGIEALHAGVHALDLEILFDLAVAVDVARQLIGLVKDKIVQEADDLIALGVSQFGVGDARRERLATVTANDAVEVEIGAVMSVRRRVADAPERCRFPLLDNAAIELHLIEIFANVVILEIAVNA